MADAVVMAEQRIRSQGLRFSAQPDQAAVRPLPPDADSERTGLLVRAVRIWTAVAALAPDQRTPELDEVLRAAARATLAAYAPVGVDARAVNRRDARRPA